MGLLLFRGIGLFAVPAAPLCVSRSFTTFVASINGQQVATALSVPELHVLVGLPTRCMGLFSATTEPAPCCTFA
jgi:hypothetical protein